MYIDCLDSFEKGFIFQEEGKWINHANDKPSVFSFHAKYYILNRSTFIQSISLTGISLPLFLFSVKGLEYKVDNDELSLPECFQGKTHISLCVGLVGKVWEGKHVDGRGRSHRVGRSRYTVLSVLYIE